MKGEEEEWRKNRSVMNMGDTEGQEGQRAKATWEEGRKRRLRGVIGTGEWGRGIGTELRV